MSLRRRRKRKRWWPTSSKSKCLNDPHWRKTQSPSEDAVVCVEPLCNLERVFGLA